MAIKIVINEKVIYLISKAEDFEKNISGSLFVEFITPQQINKAIELFEHDHKHHSLFILYPQVQELLEAIKENYKFIEAAGGVVKNTDGKTLMILRHSKWDLPKGKLEKGESPEQGALREVEEECGVHHLQLGTFIRHTYHIYTLNNRRHLKKTWWFNMHYSGNETLVPQTEESITDVRWMNDKEVKTALTNSYETIIDVINNH